MTRRLVSAVLALVLVAACSGASTGPGDPSQTVLLRYQDEPTTAQVLAATSLAQGDVLILRRGHAVRLTTTATRDRLEALPGVQRISDLGADPNPVVSMTVVLDRPTTDDDVALVQALGADAVYEAREWGLISAVRLRLERIVELDAVTAVTEVEIYLPGEGSRVG